MHSPIMHHINILKHKKILQAQQVKATCTSTNLPSVMLLTPKTTRISQPNNESTVIKSHFMTDGSKGVSCFLCGELFSSSYEMEKHYYDTHKAKKRPKLDVEESKVKNAHSNNFTDKSETKCPVCSITFKNMQEVTCHLKEVHTYKCSQCQYNFYSLFESTNHKCNRKIVKKTVKNKVHTEPLFTNLVESQKVTQPNGPVLFTLNRSALETSTSSQFLGGDRNKSNVAPLKILSIQRSNFQSVKSVAKKQSSRMKTDLRFSKYSDQELKSDLLISENIGRLKRNPELSMEVIPNKINDVVEVECSRCGILCENSSDFSIHIKECLLLSNVSMMPGTGKNKLQLRYEQVHRSREENYEISHVIKDQLESVQPIEGISVIEVNSKGGLLKGSNNMIPEVTINKCKQSENISNILKPVPMVLLPINFKANDSANGVVSSCKSKQNTLTSVSKKCDMHSMSESSKNVAVPSLLPLLMPKLEPPNQLERHHSNLPLREEDIKVEVEEEMLWDT